MEHTCGICKTEFKQLVHLLDHKLQCHYGYKNINKVERVCQCQSNLNKILTPDVNIIDSETKNLISDVDVIEQKCAETIYDEQFKIQINYTLDQSNKIK